MQVWATTLTTGPQPLGPNTGDIVLAVDNGNVSSKLVSCVELSVSSELPLRSASAVSNWRDSDVELKWPLHS